MPPCAPERRRRTAELIRTARTAPRARPARIGAISRAFLPAGVIATGLLTAVPAAAIVGGQRRPGRSLPISLSD